MCIYHILLIHSFIGGHLASFRSLALVNNVAVSTGVQTSFWEPAFIFGMLYSQIQNYQILQYSAFNFWETTVLFFTVAVLFCIPTNGRKVFCLFTFSPVLVFWFFSCVLLVAILIGGISYISSLEIYLFKFFAHF